MKPRIANSPNSECTTGFSGVDSVLSISFSRPKSKKIVNMMITTTQQKVTRPTTRSTCGEKFSSVTSTSSSAPSTGFAAFSGRAPAFSVIFLLAFNGSAACASFPASARLSSSLKSLKWFAFSESSVNFEADRTWATVVCNHAMRKEDNDVAAQR